MGLTLQRLLDEAAAKLSEAGIADALLDARLLLFHVYRMDMARWLLERNRPLGDGPQEEERRLIFCRLVEERAKRIPLQHLTGSQEFMGLEFKVNEQVLIPRQDTETLVELVLKEQKDPQRSVLDLCTGSGCIAVSLAVLGGYREVTASDLSEEALKVARENAERLCGGPDRIEFLCGDLFESIPDGRKFDIIVSNPPYISSRVIRELEPEVRDHEPRMALDGTEDGLYFYRRLASECKRYLNPGGCVYFEIGYDQALAVEELLIEAGFTRIETVKDLPGLDRVVRADAGRNV